MTARHPPELSIGRLSPGPLDAITDVAGVRVGHLTLIAGEGPLVVGRGPVRTGVTVILAHDGSIRGEPLFAGCHRLNGNGELTGLEWLRESGTLTSPIGLTNTHSVGVVRDALVARRIAETPADEPFWSLPVVGETWDGVLNDVNGLHVRPEHVAQALDAASAGPPAGGNVGGGTGMICHGFKGGIGTASRVAEDGGGYTVGALVQANHGRRDRFRVDGVPVGELIGSEVVPLPGTPVTQSGGGSIIVVVATDAPLLPHQCARLAQRAGLGVARMGGVGEHRSGDLMLAFSTANRPPMGTYGGEDPMTGEVTMLSDAHITPLFDAAVEAAEAAILDALLAAETMVGRDGITAHRLPRELLASLLSGFGRR